MSQAKSIQKQKYKRFCGHCRNQGFKFEIRGHKMNCKYKFCGCQKCKIQEYANMLSVDERKCQREQEKCKNVGKVNEVKEEKGKESGNYCKIGNKKQELDQNIELQSKSEQKNVYEFQNDDDYDGKLPPFQSLKKSTLTDSGRNSNQIDELNNFCNNFCKL